MSRNSNIIALARSILKNASIVDDYCTSNNIQTPSFAPSGPASLSIPSDVPNVAAAHEALLEETRQLHLLASGPAAILMNSDHLDDSVSLHAIYRFNIASHVPIDGDISFGSLSSACGLNVVDLRRLVRQAMTKFIFTEPKPGFVAHTAASNLLAENPLMKDLVGIHGEEKFKASAFTVDALVKWDQSKTPAETGFTLGHGTTKGVYDTFAAYPERGRRWANAMSGFASRIPSEPLIQAFDWVDLSVSPMTYTFTDHFEASLGSGIVVDVGGCHGVVSIGLAKAFPKLRFVVQDFEDAIKSRSLLDADLAERIEYMAHDVIERQPVKGAAVYFFRAVFHCLPDEYVIRGLKRQVDVMSPSSVILINDTLLHDPGKARPHQDRLRRSMDISMMSYFSSRERTENDWRELLHGIDPRLRMSVRDVLGQQTRNLMIISLRP